MPFYQPKLERKTCNIRTMLTLTYEYRTMLTITFDRRACEWTSSSRVKKKANDIRNKNRPL